MFACNCLLKSLIFMKLESKSDICAPVFICKTAMGIAELPVVANVVYDSNDLIFACVFIL